MSDASGPTDPVPPPAPASPPAPAAPNPAIVAWNELDAISRRIIAGATILAAGLLLGSLVSAWRSTGMFVPILLGAAVAAAVTAWFTSNTNAGPRPSKLPLVTIEFGAGAVATVLGVLRVVEMVADYDDLDDFGGFLGVIFTVVVAMAAGAILSGAFQRDPTLRTPRQYGDTGTRLAVSGLALVILGWVVNLTVGYWNMGAAASSLAILTLAAVLVIVAPRWKAALPEVPLAWVGAAFGVVAILLALGLWSELLELGDEHVELGVLDFVGFLLYVIGIVVIIVGGVLAGMPWLADRPKRAPKPEVPASASEVEAAAAATPTPEVTPTPAVPAPPETPRED